MLSLPPPQRQREGRRARPARLVEHLSGVMHPTSAHTSSARATHAFTRTPKVG